jgi:hypothetical protein
LRIDWATDHHDVAVVDDDGHAVTRGRVGNDAAGFAQLLTLLAEGLKAFVGSATITRASGKKTIVLHRHIKTGVSSPSARCGYLPRFGARQVRAATTPPATRPETGTTKPNGICSNKFLGQLHHCL